MSSTEFTHQFIQFSARCTAIKRSRNEVLKHLYHAGPLLGCPRHNAAMPGDTRGAGEGEPCALREHRLSALDQSPCDPSLEAKLVCSPATGKHAASKSRRSPALVASICADNPRLHSATPLPPVHAVAIDTCRTCFRTSRMMHFPRMIDISASRLVVLSQIELCSKQRLQGWKDHTARFARSCSRAKRPHHYWSLPLHARVSAQANGNNGHDE